MFGVEVESCILHMKISSMFKSRAVFCTLDNVRCISRELYFGHKTIFGVLVECSISHIKLCSEYNYVES